MDSTDKKRAGFRPLPRGVLKIEELATRETLTLKERRQARDLFAVFLEDSGGDMSELSKRAQHLYDWLERSGQTSHPLAVKEQTLSEAISFTVNKQKLPWYQDAAAKLYPEIMAGILLKGSLTHNRDTQNVELIWAVIKAQDIANGASGDISAEELTSTLTKWGASQKETRRWIRKLIAEGLLTEKSPGKYKILKVKLGAARVGLLGDLRKNSLPVLINLDIYFARLGWSKKTLRDLAVMVAIHKYEGSPTSYAKLHEEIGLVKNTLRRAVVATGIEILKTAIIINFPVTEYQPEMAKSGLYIAKVRETTGTGEVLRPRVLRRLCNVFLPSAPRGKHPKSYDGGGKRRGNGKGQKEKWLNKTPEPEQKLLFLLDHDVKYKKQKRRPGKWITCVPRSTYRAEKWFA